jgi:hypothetical protein
VIQQASSAIQAYKSFFTRQQALVIADHGDYFADIRESATGAIFLGVPMQGCCQKVGVKSDERKDQLF